MLAAVPHRHTHRGAFLPKAVDRGLPVRIQEAAAAEGGTLRLIERPGARASIGRLLVAADREQRADPAYREELAAWTPEPGSGRRDGVPATAYLSEPEGVVPAEFPGSDFSMGRGFGISREDAGEGVEGPTVAVLTTPGDQTVDWLRAGQAPEHGLLLATADSLYAWFGTAPVEVPAIRTLLRDEVGTAALPQMLLRLGYSQISAATPRRPVWDTASPIRGRRT